MSIKVKFTLNDKLMDDVEKVLMNSGVRKGDIVFSVLTLIATQIGSMGQPTPTWPEVFAELIEHYRKLHASGIQLITKNPKDTLDA